ncbi:hypothetical protein WMF04_41965 [Sorangium sp. So ce260]|uniref:hypothetical protein n=1 Tax=Sorangium sp. So ce260 TaxID=3133291 RepID=UPI003F5F10BA
MARAVEMWSLALAGSLLAGAGCSREEASTTNAATSAVASAPPVAPAAADLVGYVATYPTMEPQPGRRRLLQQFAVYQSADAKSKELARLDSGAIVDLKASYQDWMLVAFQSGGQPTLGWIELKTNDTRATTATEAEARQAAATPAPKTADGGASTGTDAGATGSGTNPDAGATGTDAGATGSGTNPDAGATGGDAGATGSGTNPDAGAADGGTGRRKIPLTRP